MRNSLFNIKLIHWVLLVLLTYPYYMVKLKAQEVENVVNGFVVDESGEAIPGVNVYCKSAQIGTITDINGKFSILVKEKMPELTFSFIGYKKQTKLIKNKKVLLKVVLKEEGYTLDETIVIGYGTQTKSTVTSAITSIKAEDMSGYIGSSIEQSIAGLVPGVRINTSDATPGGDINISVRGIGTVNSGSEPLFIVDGVPMEEGLSTLNPDDVASIEILKDAASTAVYGSRGANGVFLITTKRGSIGKTKVDANVSFTLAKAQRKYKLLNTEDLIDFFNDAGTGTGYRYTTNMTQDFFPFDETINTDWQEAIFQMALLQKYNISISGGAKGVKYRLSGEITDQPGTLIYTGMQRYAFRSNIDYDLNKKSKVTLNFSTTYNKNRKTRQGGQGSNGVIRTALEMAPFFPVYLPDGSFFSNVEYSKSVPLSEIEKGPDPSTGKYASLSNSPLDSTSDNPVKIARDYKDITDIFKTTGTINFSFNIAKGLFFKPSFSIDVQSRNNEIWYPASIGKNRIDSDASANAYRQIMWMNENILTYNRRFNRHNLALMAGVTFQNTTSKGMNISAYKFESEALPSINGGTVENGSYNIVTDKLNSYMARVSYDYNKKYMLQATFRADGSTRFGENNRFGYFPSVSAGWSMSKEKWMRRLNFISELKLRASWGLSGNNAIGQYNYLNKMGKNAYVINGNVISGWSSTNIANPDLRWEQSNQTNIGFDLGFARNRFFMQLDLYRSVTNDMLLNTQVPSTLGVTTMLMNIGSVLNKGIEFNITSRNVVGKFSWITTFNISANRNKVLALGVDSESIYAGIDQSNITKVGYPMGMFYGRVFGGIYKSMDEIIALRNDPYSGLAFDENIRPGDLKWYDLNGDGILDDDDRTIVGNPHPKFNAGMVNRFSYKNFSLSIQLEGQYGNQIYNTSLLQLLEGTNSNASILVKDRWRSEEEPGNGLVGRTFKFGDVKPTQNVNKFSNRVLEDGSYLNIRNIQFSYSFKRNMLRALKIQGLIINFNIDNLHTFTKYTGLNPQSSSFSKSTAPGIDNVGYPITRNFTLGLKLSI